MTDRKRLREAATLYEQDVRRQVAGWIDIARSALREADERAMSAGVAVAKDLEPVMHELTKARLAGREAKQLLEPRPNGAPPKRRAPRFGLTYDEQRREDRARRE